MNLVDGPFRFLDDVDHGRAEDALETVRAAVDAGASVTELATGELASVLRIIGERWQQGTYSVAQEHRATAVVDDALGQLRHRLPRVPDAPRVALVCAVGEWHVTPARMAALALGEAGWHVDLLGASTPADHVHRTLEQSRPQVLAISATVPLSLLGVPPLVAVARSLEVPVIGGGAAFGDTDHRARMLGLDGHAAGLDCAARMMSAWLDDPPEPVPPGVPADALAEQRWLLRQRSDLVARSIARLPRHPSKVTALDPRPLGHPHLDLAVTLEHLEAALVVDDPTLFDDHVAWLATMLRSARVPGHALPTALDVLARMVGPDISRSHRILTAAADSLGSGLED